MSTDLPHYNDVFKQPFRDAGYRVAYQPSCLLPSYDQQCWPIQYPQVSEWKNTVAIMHCQDFLSIRDNICPELLSMEKHFGDHSRKVIVVHWNKNLHRVYSGPLNLVYFPTHSYELLINLANTKDKWISWFDKHRSHAWQCLNGIPRTHRRLVANYLEQHYSNGILSLGTEIPLPEWNYSTYFGCENELNWQRLLPVYSDCKVNIITETQYYETPGIITEKTLMAFLAQQVPLVIGYRGIVGDLEDLGVDMFKDIVDVSYDSANDTERWQLALKNNKHILCGNFDFESLSDRRQRNLETACSLPQKWLKFFETQTNKVLKNFLDQDTF